MHTIIPKVQTFVNLFKLNIISTFHISIWSDQKTTHVDLFPCDMYGRWFNSILGPIWVTLLILCKNGVNCDPPEGPIKCSYGNSDCIITNSYGSFPDRSNCHDANAVYPDSEDQLISYVRDATKMKRKIKVLIVR